MLMLMVCCWLLVLVVFLVLLPRVSGKGRCLGWLLGLVALLGFLMFVGMWR